MFSLDTVAFFSGAHARVGGGGGAVSPIQRASCETGAISVPLLFTASLEPLAQASDSSRLQCKVGSSSLTATWYIRNSACRVIM